MQDPTIRPGHTRIVLDVPTELIERAEAAWNRPTPGSDMEGIEFWSASLAVHQERAEAWTALRTSGVAWPEWLGVALLDAERRRERDAREDAERLRSVFEDQPRTQVDAAAEVELGVRAAKALAGSAVA